MKKVRFSVFSTAAYMHFYITLLNALEAFALSILNLLVFGKVSLRVGIEFHNTFEYLEFLPPSLIIE